MIYRFNSTYSIKQITMNIHEIRGHKIIKTLHFYINNKQGVDLADMRNNWTYWS